MRLLDIIFFILCISWLASLRWIRSHPIEGEKMNENVCCKKVSRSFKLD